ncbi:DegT/DnrJ/EryC1/StrS family aminotransferase [Maribacter sp. 2210JD10-5]|uniref:DegT/DnrJ/EryC1/StrS family aminotransferase n=1 Tax=Maribacter sp. 2210JD10-5 TaxID=3386272 RepID=UPI0039BC8875
MGGTERGYVNDAFESNWIAPLGPNVNGFESDIESFIQSNVHAAALSSGTGAIHLALQILGVGKGDEVLCQSFTFSASANPIVYLGAEPVFIDSESYTWNMSPKLLEDAIEHRIKHYKKPKAIIAVHLYGMPYQVDEINQIAEKYDIPVIEDSAEALGSIYKGEKCGSLAAISILSFNGNKIITTSGGGALLSKNKDHIAQAIHLSTQARDNAPHYQHSKIGYNYRMSNVLAGIGRGQMEVLQERVDARRSNYSFYKDSLGDLPGIKFLQEPAQTYSNRWLSCILTPSFEIREKIRLELQAENIESRPLWKPMHLQPIFKDRLNYSDGTSEDLFNRGLCLPSGSNLTKEDLLRVVSIIKNIIK